VVKNPICNEKMTLFIRHRELLKQGAQSQANVSF
jgi:hypothetical protein